jgi:ribosomal protein L39E
MGRKKEFAEKTGLAEKLKTSRTLNYFLIGNGGKR